MTNPSSPARFRPVGQLIDDERRCPECDYDLRGLRIGGRCPECGTPIGFDAALAREATIIDHLRPLAAVDCLTFFLFGVSGLLFVAGLLLVGPLGLGTPVDALRLNLVLAGFWVLGVIMLVRAHARHTKGVRGLFPEWIPFTRRGALYSQLLVPALAAAHYFWVTGAFPGAGTVAAVLFVLIAAGWTPTAILLADYASFFGDSHLADHYRTCAWNLGVFGLGTALVLWLGWLSTGFSWMIRAFGWMIVAVWIFSFAAVCVSTLQLANSIRWAYVNSIALRARDRRLRERAERDAGKALPPPPTERAPDPALLARIESPREAPAEAPAPAVPHAQPRTLSERVIEPTKESPYRLEEP